jgi:hypothetical protein
MRPAIPVIKENPMWRNILSCLWLSVLSLVGGAVWAAAAPVGHVTLAVGEASRVTGAGKREALKLGDPLSEQDRIITGSDALLMIVFTDQGRLALRPDTELVIRSYRIDPSGVDTKLDFDLVRGTVRQISGQAARVQPERYRLNTLAHGVRGTDFLAKTGGQSVETYVHEGMIVLQPPASECMGAASGCAIWASQSASNAGQYLQVLSGGQVQRANANSEDVERLFGIRVAMAHPKEAAVQEGPGARARTADAVVQHGAPDLMRPGADSINIASIAAGVEPPAGGEVGGVTGPLPTSLVWGRYTDPLRLPFTLTQTYPEASNGRHGTVGEISQYALWRANPRGQLEASVRGQVDFQLAASEAFYQQGSAIQAMQMSDASLRADFDQARFATQFQLKGGQAPGIMVNATGRINDEGLFLSLTPDQRLAGAFSLNAKEAGYFFNIAGPQGQYQGITLWNAK